MRRSSRVSRSLGLLVPAVLTAAVVLAPGVAAADAGSGPEATVQGSLDELAAGIPDPAAGSEGGEEGAAGLPVPTDGLPVELPGIPGDDGTPDPSTSLTPAELRELFIQALAPLGISEDCVNGVFDGFEDVIAALTEQGPEDLENLLTALVGGLSDPGSFDPATLSDSALAEALQGLAKTLQEECMPAAPGGEEQPPVDQGGQDPTPVQTPPAPSPAPVVYLGYAPTGGTPEHSAGTVPLAAMGGVVLLSAAGAAGYRMSNRGTRSRG